MTMPDTVQDLTMKSKLLEAGIIANTHGVRGEVRIQPWADSPAFLADLDFLYIDGSPVRIVSAKIHKGCVIAALEGVSDIAGAIAIKSKVVYINRDDVKLEEGRNFIADLIGLRAIDAKTDTVLGVVSDVMVNPANNIYVIKGAPREMLIPAVADFVEEVNIAEGYIKFNLIEGL